MKRTTLIILVSILISFVLGSYFYPQMPEKMASHWNLKGEVDGFISKFWGVFLLPIFSFLLFLLFLFIPKIDPLKENIEKFRKYFDNFSVLFFLFLFYFYLLIIFWNLGLKFDINRTIIPALGPLFYYCGVLIENSKRNWFVGIRTPWTLSSDNVWEKTNKIGGRLFKVIGWIVLLGVLFPKYNLFFILIPLFILVFFAIFYSYFEYKKERK